MGQLYLFNQARENVRQLPSTGLMTSSAKGICRILPCLWAFITIVALAASTLTQQTVYYLLGMATMGNVAIPWTSVYKRY
jgi:hypothetical protein